MLSFQVVGAASALALATAFFLLSRSRQRRPFPPGPRPLPLIGNLFDIPRSNAWETFFKWKDLYGDVVYLNILGRSIVLLNSTQATYDLLEKRGTIYSDRPQFPLINLAGHQWNFGFKPYGKEWQSLRRAFTSQYNSMATLRSFHDAHRVSSSTFLLNVLREPDQTSNHMRVRGAQVIFNVTYGISVYSENIMQTTEDVMDLVSVALYPSMWIINPISMLNSFPRWLGGKFVSERVQKWQTDLENLRNVPFEIAKKTLASGTAKPCFTVNLLQELGTSSDAAAMDEGVIRDTAAIALGVFLLTMVLNEAVQRLAQSEIDSVVGTDRLPDFIDRERLPFITAIMKEVLRWHPPAPTGIPHELTQDDIYQGMHIPAGSIVMGNIWGLVHDPQMYPDPFKFDPTRYISDGKFDCSKNDPSRFVFGFGRRACPGKLFTEDSLWLMIAQFLAVYSVSPPTSGPTPRAAFRSGAISRPLPFKHLIRPRSHAARNLLAQLTQE
ncbi:cytochrome P450 [Mycena capillaripes]|nr:cytochrome P450 [Mycena capillaripes]